MATACSEPLTLWNLGPQQVRIDFRGGRLVDNAGLLALRHLDKELAVLAGLARRLPDPRSQKDVTHSCERLLTQQVYQIVAGSPDGNDAQTLRDDSLFQIRADGAPSGEAALASGSTLARFQQAYTRRRGGRPPEEQAVLPEVSAAQTQRLTIGNDYLVALCIRTRRPPPAFSIRDVEASDDPTPGQQGLSSSHGYFGQHPYFPLFVSDGTTGFPRAAWLRPGTGHARCGAVETLRAVVERLRAAWPGVLILVRGDTGLAVPEVSAYGEAEGRLYARGFARNAVLEARTDPLLADLQAYYHGYGRREPPVQRFEVLEGYQAQGWSRPRRLVAKLEINPLGINRRFVVTNLSGDPRGIYRGFYVQRGAVPERPIGERKNGLAADRLSFQPWRANAWKLLEPTLA